MVSAYWLVGREIVEAEQHGRQRAGYGQETIDQLSERLRASLGKGFTPSNLRYMWLFYRTYPHLLDQNNYHAMSDKSLDDTFSSTIRHATRDKSWKPGRLHPTHSWTHYRLLTKVESTYARAFYEIEAARVGLKANTSTHERNYSMAVFE